MNNNSKDNDERRKYKRMSVALPFNYKNLVYSQDSIAEAYTKNIGGGGAKFAVTRFMPEDTRIKMSILIREGANPIDITSKIIWITKMPYNDIYHLGVEFVDITKEDRDRIVDYIHNIY